MTKEKEIQIIRRRNKPNMKEATKHLIALTEEKEQIFYSLLEEGKTILEACNIIGISRGTYKNHGMRNPKFAIKSKDIIMKSKLKKVKKKPAKIIIKDKKKEMGRPTAMTEQVITKLKEGFAQGFSVENACIWADISTATYYDYAAKNPNFSEQCKTLQKKPLIKSILVINKALNEGDVGTAKWYAERKAKDEFSLRQELTGENGEPIKQQVVYIEKEEKDDYENHIDEVIDGD